MTDAFISYIENRFFTIMSAEHPEVELMFSNMDLPESDTFSELRVLASEDTRPVAVGIEARSRNVGLVQIDIFTPKDIGAGRGRRLAKFAASMFHRHNRQIADEGYATFRDAAIVDKGEARGRNKHQVRIPYRYDFRQDFLAA